MDIDGDGIGEPVLSYEKPIKGYPVTAPSTDDEFSNTKLGFQWEWNHNPRDTHWSLSERPGWLRLMASLPVKPETYGDSKKVLDPFWRACNTISQRIMGTTTGTAIAKFDLGRMKPGQKAGFVRLGGVYHMLGVEMDEKGNRNLFFAGTEEKTLEGPIVSESILFVRTTNEGNRAWYEYSTDGKTFERFGPEFTLKFGKWSGDRLGFFCWNEMEEEGQLDVDYFHYDYDGPKAASK